MMAEVVLTVTRMRMKGGRLVHLMNDGRALCFAKSNIWTAPLCTSRECGSCGLTAAAQPYRVVITNPRPLGYGTLKRGPEPAS